MTRAVASMAVALWASEVLAKGEGGGGDVPCESALAPRPYAVRLPLDADSPILVATNFGILISGDDGETFEVICPEAIERFTVDNGLQVLYSTPTLMGLPGGSILATRYPLGLLYSEDGCDWAIVDDPVVRTRAVSSLTLTPSGTLFASFSSGSDPLGIAASADGLTFTLTSEQSASLTYDGVMAASDDLTLYAIRTQFGATTTQALLVSTDAGASFNPVRSVDGLSLSLGAIDAADPNRLLVRQRSTTVCVVTDTLILDEAGGTSPVVVATLDNEPITGAVIRPGGDLWIATWTGGVNKSSDGGQNWVPAGGPARARCLVAGADEILACLASPDPELGLVARTTDEGATWLPFVTWDNIVGPLPCLADVCEAHWQKLQASWISPTQLPDGGPEDGRRFDLGGGAGDEPATDSTGCECAVRGGRGTGGGWVPLAAVALALLRRRSLGC